MFLDVNGIRIYAERAGKGDPLLFISGSGADLRRRPNQYDSPLGAAFDLISYDQRGLGQTENPSEPFTMADYADDAAGLLDHLDIAEIDVMGVSFGGMVAQELVLRHPSKVRRLVLACTSSGGAGGSSFPLHELATLPDDERVATHLRLADTRRTDEWIADHPDAWQRLLTMSAASEPHAELDDGPTKQLAARRHHDTYGRLGSISCPVLVAGGRFDGIAPVSNQEMLQRTIPDSELALFDGGHLFLVQDKRAYPAIINWLRR